MAAACVDDSTDSLGVNGIPAGRQCLISRIVFKGIQHVESFQRCNPQIVNQNILLGAVGHKAQLGHSTLRSHGNGGGADCVPGAGFFRTLCPDLGGQLLAFLMHLHLVPRSVGVGGGSGVDSTGNAVALVTIVGSIPQTIGYTAAEDGVEIVAAINTMNSGIDAGSIGVNSTCLKAQIEGQFLVDHAGGNRKVIPGGAELHTQGLAMAAACVDNSTDCLGVDGALPGRQSCICCVALVVIFCIHGHKARSLCCGCSRDSCQNTAGQK